MIFDTRKVCFTLLPTFSSLHIYMHICCHIAHYYMLLVCVTFDAVFSHLQLTYGCTVNKINEKKKFCRPTVTIFLRC